MRLSRNFVSDYIDIDPSLGVTKIAEDMTSVGNEYDYAGKLINCTNLITGEVICCEDIKDTHLHACQVSIGKEVLNIVCGAPNVRKGIKVIVALNGAKLPNGEIKKTIIRGYESNGMICSKAELGFESKFLDAKDKEGIYELPSDIEVGVDPIKVLGFDDEVIDFELTSNRGDLLSIMGMAYELGAIYKKKVKSPDLSYQEEKEKIQDNFSVSLKTENCSLFLAKKVKDVVIKESPEFIKNRLIASGIRPINNVVDISNYVMLETGQPLHFYDANKLGDTLIVRMADNDEELVTLDSEKRSLSNEDIVIANETSAVGLAGVMGGLSTEVDENTRDIIIEAAVFNPTCIRKTSKKILRSEASNRFEKGLDANRTYMAIDRSCHLLAKYADAKIISGLVEVGLNTASEKVIELPYSKIQKVLGISIPKEEVIEIFEDLGFLVSVSADRFVVTVPSRRLDIQIPEDLIEEVGRIYGIDKISGKLPSLEMVLGNYDKLQREMKHKLASLGLNETCSYSLISNLDVHKYTKDEFQEIYLNDPMSDTRNTLRYSLLSSLVDIYQYNKSHSQTDVSIFEIGKGFKKENQEYKEELKLGILISGEYYLDIPNKKADFYVLKGIVEEFLDYFGYQGRYHFTVDEKIPTELHPLQSASIYLQGKPIGIIGKIHPSVIKDQVFVAEINLDHLQKIHPSKMSFKEISKFPVVNKDVAFIVSKEVFSEDIISVIKKSGGKLLNKINIFDIYEGENIDSSKKSIAFNLEFKDPNRTLTEEEVMECFNRIIEEVTSKLKCEVRDK